MKRLLPSGQQRKEYVMKFTEMPYTHPNLEEFQTSAGELLEQIRSAATAEEQIAAYLAYEEKSKDISTLCSLAATPSIPKTASMKRRATISMKSAPSSRKSIRKSISPC